MAQKIRPESISRIAKETIQRHAYKNGVYMHLPIYDSLSLIACRFFWLWVYKMLIKAGLIDKNLNANSFMHENKFAVTWREVEGGDVNVQPIETDFLYEGDYITCMGFAVLTRLIEEVSFDGRNIYLIPPPGEFAGSEYWETFQSNIIQYGR